MLALMPQNANAISIADANAIAKASATMPMLADDNANNYVKQWL